MIRRVVEFAGFLIFLSLISAELDSKELHRMRDDYQCGQELQQYLDKLIVKSAKTSETKIKKAKIKLDVRVVNLDRS